MKTLTVYQVSYLFRPHSTIGCGQAIDNGFFDLH
jgi:hypothetical protein